MVQLRAKEYVTWYGFVSNEVNQDILVNHHSHSPYCKMPLELCGYYFDDTQIHSSLIKSQFLLAKSPCFTSFACIHHCLQPLQQKEYTTNMANHARSRFLLLKASWKPLTSPHFSSFPRFFVAISPAFPQDCCALEQLLQAPRHPTAPDEDGYATLHEAARCGHLEAVLLLLVANAEVDGRGSGLICRWLTTAWWLLVVDRGNYRI